MKRLLAVLTLAAALPSAAVERSPEEESVRAKALAAAAQPQPAPRASAPFRAAPDPIGELFRPEDAAAPRPRGACDQHARALCYDATERRIVYRPARELMPAIEGLRAESVSLRHGRITLKYSFR